MISSFRTGDSQNTGQALSAHRYIQPPILIPAICITIYTDNIISFLHQKINVKLIYIFYIYFTLIFAYLPPINRRFLRFFCWNISQLTLWILFQHASQPKDRAARGSPAARQMWEKRNAFEMCFLFPSQYTTFKIQIRAIYRPICRFFVYFFSYNRRWRPAVPSLNGDPAAHDSNLALLPSLLCSQHIIKHIFSPMSRCIHNGTRGQIVRHLPGGSSDLIYRSFAHSVVDGNITTAWFRWQS